MAEPPKVEIRRGRPEDAARVAWVHLRAWQQTYAGLIPESYLDALMDGLPERTARWRGWLEETPPWVAVSDPGEVIGFAAYGPARDEDAIPSVTGEIWGIYVLAEHWDQGIGRRLMDACLASLREDGFAETTLWVLDRNVRARRFYERGGWRANGAAKDDARDGFTFHEVRYRIDLRHRLPT
jgi:ribosomal protein S18 acetylase RimI-like enzyme